MLTLDTATQIVQATLAYARSSGVSPLAVVVLDAGGHTITSSREDRAGFLRNDIALGKAWGALGLGFSSAGIASAAQRFPEFFNALAAATGGRVVPAAGGVLVLAGGEIIGAVGVSGDSSEADQSCALVGVRAGGFASEPAHPSV